MNCIFFKGIKKSRAARWVPLRSSLSCFLLILNLPHGSSFVFLSIASMLPAKAKNPTTASVRLACGSLRAAAELFY
jgi:hypothetical protein